MHGNQADYTIDKLVEALARSAMRTNTRRTADELLLQAADFAGEMSLIEATLPEVLDAIREFSETSKWPPAFSEIRSAVMDKVTDRHKAGIVAAAQEAATPLPALDKGDVDWSNVRTADLRPGYDYSQDADWLKGQASLAAVYEGKAEPSSFALAVMEIDRKRQANERLDFEGAATRPDDDCPYCKGARRVSIGGYNPIGHPGDVNESAIDKEGSRHVACPGCCPRGTYSPDAERAAALAHRKASSPQQSEWEPF